MAGVAPHPQRTERLGPFPEYVTGGPHNPMGARGMYLYSSNRDTLYRIHGTNQPEYIGSAVSSGCIRMTNEDVIDLYNRVKVGTPVIVLGPHQGDSPFSPGLRAPSDPSQLTVARPLLQAPSTTCTTSGGTPSRAGIKLVPSPPDTTMCLPSSTTCP